MSDSNPHTLIVGTGAMACLFAARLSAAGLPVMMLGTWPEGVRALQTEGVRLVEPDGTEQAYALRATLDPQDCQDIQTALVLVKSWQTQRAARQLADSLSPGGVALTLQNGMGNVEKMSSVLGAARVALGATTAGAYLLGPGRVRAAGQGVISLGIHARLNVLSDRLRQAGFLVENVPDMNALLWGKLVINAAINPLTALLRVPNGELLNRQSARSLMSAVAREAAAVAVAKGVHLPYPDPVVAAETIARRTAENYSSMLQDVQRGAPTEIDAICGAIVETGEQMDVHAPFNRTLWQLVKALEGK